MAVFFGQFLDHDISLSPEHELEQPCCNLEEPVDCCNIEQKLGRNDSECFKIMMPDNDPLGTCMHLTRSTPHCSSGWPPSIQREQQNVITSFLDASNVYGSDADRSRRVRTMMRGTLKVTQRNNLLPEEELQKCKITLYIF